MPDTYPKRPKFFSCQFIRLLGKCCAANDIGVEAAYLLCLIVITEDARGYRSPVTFYNGQLLAMFGRTTDEALLRARKRAVDAGWLHYEPGTKGVAGRYWVTIPDGLQDWDDHPSDEELGIRSPAQTEGKARGKRDECADTTERKARGMCGSSFPIPIPIPVPPAKAGEDTPPVEAKPARVLSASLIDQARALPIPAHLDTPEFRAEWEAWIEYRARLPGKRPTVRAFVIHLDTLAKGSADDAVALIRYSIAGNYPTVYADRAGRLAGRGVPAADQRREARAATEFAEPDKPLPVLRIGGVSRA